MNSDQRPAVPRRELIRALFLALWNKVVEFLVLAKLRWQKGGADRFDRWALGAIHGLMLGQIDRMRRFCEGHALQERFPESNTGVHNAHVVLCDPRPVWRTDAAREATLLQEALGAGSAVHHIGSTAIEGLAAKPIVDMAITLPAERFSAEFERAAPKLRTLGYRYLGVRGGHFFEKAAASVRTHALQVHPEGNQVLTELLLFRDALRRDAALRANYEATKRALATFFPQRRLFYVFYKSHWIDDWQWRHSDVADWADWFAGQKRAHAELAKTSRARR